jgi:hypothetical protein
LSELGGTRARIMAYVHEHGDVARMTEIMTGLGLSPGSASGHLNNLVRLGRLTRPQRGIYVVAGTSPELPPPVDRSAAVAKRNAVVWAHLPEPERRKRVDALTRGRKAAARRRHGRSGHGA